MPDHTVLVTDEKTIVRDVAVPPTVVQLGQRIESGAGLSVEDVDDRIDIYNYKFAPEMYGAYGDASVAAATYGQTGHDDSAAIQTAIDNASANAIAGGKTAIVEFQGKGYFCNVILKPGVILKGDGFATKLMAAPNSATAVLGSIKAGALGASEPIRVQIHDLCVDGNYGNGATGGGIEIVSSNNDTFTAGHPTTSPGIWNVNDPAPVLHNLIVQRCNGIGVKLGRNMRGAQVDNLFVYSCKNNGIYVSCTDSEWTNVQSGLCAHGIFVDGQDNKFSNCKTWYAGTTVGAAACAVGVFGTGWEITAGHTQLTGCQSQDNDGYGLSIHNCDGVQVTGYQSGGDVTGCVYLRTIHGCKIDVMMTIADRGTTGFGITVDFGSVQNNTIKFRDYSANGRTAGYKIVRFLNGGNFGVNSWELPGDGAMTALNFTAALTPAFENGKFQWMTLTGNTTINAAPADAVVWPGQECGFVFVQDATGGRTVTWDASWGTPPAIDSTPNSTTVVIFRNVGYGATPTWKYSRSTVDGDNLTSILQTWRTLRDGHVGLFINSTAVAQLVLVSNGQIATNANNAFLGAFRIDPGDVTTPKGKKAKIRLRCWGASNGTNPNVTITVELRQITGVVNTAVSQGPGVTTGPAIASAALVFNSATQMVSGASAEIDFTAANFPNGFYVITATLNQAVAANAAAEIGAELQTHIV